MRMPRSVLQPLVAGHAGAGRHGARGLGPAPDHSVGRRRETESSLVHPRRPGLGEYALRHQRPAVDAGTAPGRQPWILPMPDFLMAASQLVISVCMKASVALGSARGMSMPMPLSQSRMSESPAFLAAW